VPYINRQDRIHWGKLLKPLLENFGEGTSAGELNYIITRLVKTFVDTRGGNYEAHNAAYGVLDCVAREFYRRQTSPYEDDKIQVNGDLY
jgi:hypothetical protein